MTFPLWAWLVSLGVAYAGGVWHGMTFAEWLPAIKRRFKRD
jgi:hypothetical protein